MNAIASDAAASDDSDLRQIAHIGTIISATSIAVAERLGKSGRDVLGAMVLGYEAAGRIEAWLRRRGAGGGGERCGGRGGGGGGGKWAAAGLAGRFLANTFHQGHDGGLLPVEIGA